MQIDLMLVRLVDKLQNALPDEAKNEMTGAHAKPLSDWEGRDAIQFIDRLRRATGDEYMGLGEMPCRLGAGDYLIELTSRCATLGEAIRQGSRFMEIATGAFKIELEDRDGLAAIVIKQLPGANDPEYAISDWLMIAWHKLSQFLLGSELPLQRAEFIHPLDAAYSAYTVMFNTDCAFKQPHSALLFDNRYLSKRVVKTPADAEALINHKIGYFSRPIGLARTWSQTLRQLFRSELASARPMSSIEEIAEEFGVSSQTLRRRLRDEGKSYRELKREARQEAALDNLSAQKTTVGDASIAAGYAEPNSLTKALKSSQGISSSDLRQQVQSWKDEAGKKDPVASD